MSTFLALGIAFVALAVALLAYWRALSGFNQAWDALKPLLLESERITVRRLELESELDARIKRLLARESYWRGEATRRSESARAEGGLPDDAHVAEPHPPFSAGESTLDLRRRLRGA